MTSPGRERGLAIGLVAAQAALLLAFFAAPNGDAWTPPGWLEEIASVAAVAGGAVLVVAAVTLGRSLTVLPTPVERGSLRTGGLYRFVRHPIYTGLLAFVAARAVTSGSPVKVGLAAALLGLLAGKARWEEAMLRRRYPTYRDYAARTGRFLPGLGRRRGS